MGMTREWAHAGRKVSVEIRTAASAEQVWLSWAEPSRVTQWFVDQAEGRAIVGESIRWRFTDLDLDLRMDVLEAIPDRRLVLATPAVKGNLPRILEIDVDQADGKTRMQLTESGFAEGEAGEDVYQSVVSGWRITSSILRLYLERYFGMKKSNKLLMKPTKAAYAKIFEYFTTPEKVSAWIGELTQVGEARPYRLRLEAGGELTGRFLAVTDRELLLGADQIDGTVEFRAFPKGDGRAIGVRLLSWRLTPEQMTDLSAVMLSALNRLGEEVG
jgi:uncharacterized protein YndB with AHSA1/START domain